jgi:hypothetical protein
VDLQQILDLLDPVDLAKRLLGDLLLIVAADHAVQHEPSFERLQPQLLPCQVRTLPERRASTINQGSVDHSIIAFAGEEGRLGGGPVVRAGRRRSDESYFRISIYIANCARVETGDPIRLPAAYVAASDLRRVTDMTP